MATTIDSSSNPLAAYGYDQNTGQQLAQSLGMTTQQLAAAFAATPTTGGSAPQTTSYGMTTGGGPGGRDLQSTINQLQIGQAAGQGQQNQGPPMSQAGQVSNDPMNAATNLGAAALGMPAIYNPTPGQIPAGSKGGIAQVASPVSSGSVPGVPQGPWNTTASVFGQPSQTNQGLQYWGSTPGGGSPADAAAIEKAQGMAPGTIGQQFYQAGVQQGKIQPAGPMAPTAGGTPTAVMPANAPGAGGAAGPGTPWATAPAAPGISVGATPPLQTGAPPAPMGMNDPAHTQALAHAGMAMYSHFGGDPHSATPEDIMGFHNQLQGMVGSLIGGGTQGANYTQGVNQPPNTVAPPTKMATGGMVPGRGNRDTVPALLTPGEYVIPKDQVAQAFGGRTPVRMQSGGLVTDDQEPRETRRQSLTVPGQQSSPQTQEPSPTSAQGSSSDAPAAPGGSSNMMQMAQMTQQAQAANANVGSGAPGSIDNLGTLGDESIITGQGGPGQPGGPGTQQMMTAGAISDLANGLTKAAQTYANSFKSWQMQKSAIPTSVPNYQTTNFRQDQTT
jgi:hypothetical protein